MRPGGGGRILRGLARLRLPACSEWLRPSTLSAFLGAFLALCCACGPEKPAAPAHTNPLDPANAGSGGDPFGLTLQRLTSSPSTGIRLSWTPPELAGIAGLRVYRRTTSGASWTRLAELGAAARSYADTTTVGWQTYDYQVRAVDTERRESATRETAQTLRSAPLVLLNAGASSSCGNEVTLRVVAVDADWVRVAGTQADLDAATERPLPDAGLSIPWTLPSGPGPKPVWVRVGNSEAGSEQSSVSIDVVQPPSVPEGVTATAECGAIAVSWQQVPGATGYFVYRDGVLRTSQAVTGLSWTDAAPASVAHAYQVSARGGCEGQQSGATAAVAALPARPAAPTGVSAAVWENIVVTWSAVSGVSGYRVYRDQSAIPVADLVQSRRWTDAAATAGAHRYEVTALAWGGGPCGESARSALTASVTAGSLPSGWVKVSPSPTVPFTMGSPTSEPGRESNEIQHQVTLTKPFYMCDHEVTQLEWRSVMGTSSSYFTGDNLPVERVSWDDCIDYCNARSAREGLEPVYTRHGATVTWDQLKNGYRLPTEAEWEYACRAGQSTAFCNGAITITDCSPVDPKLTLVGWYCGNASSTTHAVKGKLANSSGLYDMHGNVWEWCWDWYEAYSGTPTDPTGPASGFGRVLRGGGWGTIARSCRSAIRSGYDPGYTDSAFGLRLSRAAR